MKTQIFHKMKYGFRGHCIRSYKVTFLTFIEKLEKWFGIYNSYKKTTHFYINTGKTEIIYFQLGINQIFPVSSILSKLTNFFFKLPLPMTEKKVQSKVVCKENIEFLLSSQT